MPGVQTPGDVFGAGSEDVPDRKLVSPFSKLPVPVGRRGVTARRVLATSLPLQRSLPGAGILYAAQGLGVD